MSDDDSNDSESGIRYKTTNIRHRNINCESRESKCEMSIHASSNREIHNSRKNDRRKRRRSEKRQKRIKVNENKAFGDFSKVQSSSNDEQKSISFKQSLDSRLCVRVEENISYVHGPSLPPALRKIERTDDLVTTESSSITKQRILGPDVNPNVKKNSNDDVLDISSHESDLEDIIGPLPPGMLPKKRPFLELEERAIELRRKGCEEKSVVGPVREEWMLELPEVNAKTSGLGPRKFRAKGAPEMDDRSAWTDTPRQQKPHKSEDHLKKEYRSKEIKRRDQEQQKAVEKHKKQTNRNESLLDMHRKKTEKSNSKHDLGKTERRPFNRDTDLRTTHMDESQKQNLIRKSQLLDSRFSSGEEKYL